MAMIEPLLIRIPAGWFWMGSEAGQDVEGPVHRVWVDAFAMAATQVTVEEYGRFLAATGRDAPPKWGDAEFADPRQPVVAVSWFDAVAYCEWLSSVTGASVKIRQSWPRLPSIMLLLSLSS